MQHSTTSNATTYQANRSHCRDAEIQRSRYAPNLTPACYCRQLNCHQYQSEVAAGGRR